MTTNKRRLVRIVVRALNRFEELGSEADLAFEMDREFDGGEFSCKATYDRLDRDLDVAAQELGFANAALVYDIAASLHVYRYDGPVDGLLGVRVPLPL